MYVQRIQEEHLTNAYSYYMAINKDKTFKKDKTINKRKQQSRKTKLLNNNIK